MGRVSIVSDASLMLMLRAQCEQALKFLLQTLRTLYNYWKTRLYSTGKWGAPFDLYEFSHTGRERLIRTRLIRSST